MKKQKLLCMLLASVLLIGLISGCGGGSDSGGDSVKTLNILMETVPDTDCVVDYVDEFTAQTGIKVNIESINYSAMHEKLLTQLLSRTNTYDVIVVDCYWAGEFLAAGWLEQLDPYIEESGFALEPYFDSMMEMLGVKPGETYMIPFYNYMLSLVYRTDVFDGAEYTIPDNMDDYIEMCKQITSVNGDSLYGAVMQGLRPDPIAMEWINYLFSCGGDFYDRSGNIVINSPEAVKALDMYVDNMKNAAPSGAPGFGFDEAFNVFAQGNAATYVTYNWMVPKLNNADESSIAGLADITPMPGGYSLNAGWGWGIPHNAPDKEASWQFIEWVESFDVTKARALEGGAPTRVDIMSDPAVLAQFPHLSTVQEIMATSKIIPVIADAPQLIEVLGRELSEAVAGSKSSKQALDMVADEMKNMQ